MNKRKLTVTILAFILFSIHIFGQNTISYTYDSAGNRTGRRASENTIALHAISPQNGPTADNLKMISVRARNNEVPILNNTLAVNISTIGHTDWKFALFKKIWIGYSHMIDPAQKSMRLVLLQCISND